MEKLNFKKSFNELKFELELIKNQKRTLEEKLSHINLEKYPFFYKS